MPTYDAGRGSSTGVGLETTWGTAVSRTTWLTILSFSMTDQIESAPIPHISASGAGFADNFDTRRICEGSIEIPFVFMGAGIWLTAAMLDAVSSTSAGSPYTHTWDLGTTLQSMTLEQVLGDTGNIELFEGVVIPSWSLSCSAGDYCRLRANLLGQLSQARTSGSATAPGATLTSRAVKYHQFAADTGGSGTAGSFSFNGVEYEADSFELSVDNKLARNDILGTLATGEPVQTDYSEVRIRFTLKKKVDTLYAANKAGTVSDVVCAFYADADNQLKITVRNCRLAPVQEPLNSAGPVQQTVEFIGYADAPGSGASDSVLTIALTNTNSSALAN